MNASQSIEKFVFLISLDNADQNTNQTSRAESSRKADEEVAVLGHFKGVLEHETGLVFDVFEEAILADSFSFVQKHSSSSAFVLFADLAHRDFLNLFLLAFAAFASFLLLTFPTLLLPAAFALYNLSRDCSFSDFLNVLLDSVILVMIASAGQFILLHVVCCISFIRMGNSSAKLLLIGLDNAGKSTILARIMEPGEAVSGITPTIGYKKDKFTRDGVDYEVLDMSGEAKYRDLWQSNATTIDEKDRISGIIFVVDSSDKMRIRVAKSELDMLLENRSLSSQIPFLFYANKTDIKGACSLEEVSQLLDLPNLKREYQIFSCSATTGKGVQEGIQWLTALVKIKMELAAR